MPQSPTINRSLVLVERPGGEPTPAPLRLDTGPVPAPGPKQMLQRAEYLSLDPYMRGLLCRPRPSCRRYGGRDGRAGRSLACEGL